MNFDKTAHIAKMKPVVTKFITTLKKSGIEFEPTDGDIENIILTKGDKKWKMSHHSFYRFSGICNVYKESDKEMIPVPVTDEMYLNDFIKPIIENIFNNI